MRLQERIKIDDHEFTIRELTVKEIINLLSGSDDESADGSNPKTEETNEEKKLITMLGDVFGEDGYLKKFMKIAMPGTKIADLIELAPSELMQIWEKVKVVNSHFFDVAQKMELGSTLLGLIKELLTDFSQHAASLSKRAMEEEFSGMDTPFSLKPSAPSKKTGSVPKKKRPKQ